MAEKVKNCETCEHFNGKGCKIDLSMPCDGWEEFDYLETFREPQMKCPYCGHIDGDSWEKPGEDGEEMTMECESCGKEFYYERCIETSYTTNRKGVADNG